MARDLLPLSADLPADLLAEIEGARDTLAASKAGSTHKAYASDWVRFCAFCDARNVEALPAHPDIVALFAHVEAEAGIAPVTIGRRVAAINHHHKEAGFPSPTARDAAGVIATMLAGVRRKYARRKEQKAPAEADVLWRKLQMIARGLRRGGHPRPRRVPAQPAPLPGQLDLIDALEGPAIAVTATEDGVIP